MPEFYLRTDHWQDAIESLEAAQEFAGRVTTDARQWKWLFIALHSAAQGFMVLALEQGNSLHVMTTDRMRRWMRAYDAGSSLPEDRLDFFLELYGKVKSPVVQRFVGSRPFVPGRTHDDSLAYLNELRNNFIHFFPKGWSILLPGLAEACLEALDLIDFLGWESQTIIWSEPELLERGQVASAALRSTLRTVAQLNANIES